MVEEREDNKKKDSKLTRMTLGGLEQLPGFSGDKGDYSYIKRVKFIAGESKIKIRGLDSKYSYTPEEYNPDSGDSFLFNLDRFLDNQGWYLVYCVAGKTFFSDLQMVGSLHSKKEKSK